MPNKTLSSSCRGLLTVINTLCITAKVDAGPAYLQTIENFKLSLK